MTAGDRPGDRAEAPPAGAGAAGAHAPRDGAPLPAPPCAVPKPSPCVGAPFVRASEGIRTIFLVTLAAACAPLAAGIVLFGWRAAGVAALAVFGCVGIERIFYSVTRGPALIGRSHAWLTGVLLALTLPAYVPWYVPLLAAAFAIIVGKAIFGGVGHFLWQPALLGRIAVAVLLPQTLAAPLPERPHLGPVLQRSRILVGDIRDARAAQPYVAWSRAGPDDADALLVPRPTHVLGGLTRRDAPAFSGLASRAPGEPGRTKPALLTRLPPLGDLLVGARPGDIGETCILVLLVAGLYLVYRNYVKVHLPLAMLAAAWAVAAVAPVRLAMPDGPLRQLWLPLTAAGLDVGITYTTYQLLSGPLVLAAVLLATEMTSRPVTTGGQVIFGAGCGALAMGLQLYVDVPAPAYIAVLAMNTLTPALEGAWRPRVLGQGFLSRWRR